MIRNEAVRNGVVFAPGEDNALAANFAGQTLLRQLVDDSTLDVAVSNVTFAPGARTNWHVHRDGYQILLITGGDGWIQEEGGPARRVAPGDVVTIGEGVKHWHGASADSWFVHIAITKGVTEWLEPVGDAEYGAVEG
ncbi:Cupin domain protein [Propionibacterium cyclohexanicum]|uniref:Cupin domain protein n=1 Tax=Propionibacterium cyclohexanicum TaxID=64702 RepID=A0A1H9SYF3_9ACTN|nr:cupin domain-containing protein [Propionibacterium cyclohexanicum]SER90060.1 Cupin domain protein [Propionibacterium cyclohexanicum]